MKRCFSNKKLVSIFITLSVILLLLTLGPVEAFVLGFTVFEDEVVQGQPIDIEIEVEIEPGEFLDLQHITLLLDGPQDLICRFLPNGTLINDCPNVQITQTETTAYGFGYGYDQGYLPGFLKYEVTINSASLAPGAYAARYIITAPDAGLESPEQMIYIQPPEAVQSCSVRASGGTATLDEESYRNRNRLNLYVPSDKATGGKGSFTAQNGDRLSYTYQVNSAVQLDPNTIMFYVSGELRKHTTVYQEAATITLNKATSKIKIEGETLDVESMNVGFMKC
ncbi:MAG: hypothetical protein ABH864_00475 [archaeon]